MLDCHGKSFATGAPSESAIFVHPKGARSPAECGATRHNQAPISPTTCGFSHHRRSHHSPTSIQVPSLTPEARAPDRREHRKVRGFCVAGDAPAGARDPQPGTVSVHHPSRHSPMRRGCTGVHPGPDPPRSRTDPTHTGIGISVGHPSWPAQRSSRTFADSLRFRPHPSDGPPMATINQRTLADGRARYWAKRRLGGTPQSDPGVVVLVAVACPRPACISE